MRENGKEKRGTAKVTRNTTSLSLETESSSWRSQVKRRLVAAKSAKFLMLIVPVEKQATPLAFFGQSGFPLIEAHWMERRINTLILKALNLHLLYNLWKKQLIIKSSDYITFVNIYLVHVCFNVSNTRGSQELYRRFPGLTPSQKPLELQIRDLKEEGSSSIHLTQKKGFKKVSNQSNTKPISLPSIPSDTPDSRPVITGLETSYREGDRISINCTSHRSRPPALVMWKLQNSTIAENSTILDDYLVPYPPVVEEDPPLYTSTLGLQLTARRTLFTKGILRLSCTATVHTYEWKTDVDLHLDHVTYTQPHHLPTQLNTGSSPCGPHVCSSLLSLLLFISIINLRNPRLLH
ncbi:uncharacterized protein LOC143029064 [Oratosquilla oratoria]|uniref:uncharacterized protein LOC143029064 n=1 Tax=Oratosquilla oratoria TaxID=337810 RepID=UPI003F76F19F